MSPGWACTRTRTSTPTLPSCPSASAIPVFSDSAIPTTGTNRGPTSNCSPATSSYSAVRPVSHSTECQGFTQGLPTRIQDCRMDDSTSRCAFPDCHSSAFALAEVPLIQLRRQGSDMDGVLWGAAVPVSYTHLRAHETVLD